jgi:tetratricopeptide (TPR) repeat protein
LGFLNVYPFRYSYVADHFQYLACLGVIVLTSAAMVSTGQRWPAWARVAGQGAAMGVLLVLGVLTWQQSAMYGDVETLYRTTIQRNPQCWMAYNNLGNLLARTSRVAETIECYEQALRIRSDAELHTNLGDLLTKLGRLPEAVEHLEEAVRLRPDYALSHNNLGNALVSSGRHAEAIEHYQAALRIKPDYVEARTNLGAALASQGHLAEALEHYQKAVEIQPGYAEAQYNWGSTLAGLNRLPEAVEHYQEALRLQPDHVQVHYNLGVVLAAMGRNAEAIDHFEHALRLKPDLGLAMLGLSSALARSGKLREAIDWGRQAVRQLPDDPQANQSVAWLLATHEPVPGGAAQQAVELAQHACTLQGKPDAGRLDTLGAAYASAGRFDEAIATAKEARRLAEAAGQIVLAEDIHMRLQLYRDRKPYREPIPARPR